MKVLIGMEFSGIVRDAFLKRGHDAVSCDLLPTDSPGPHYQGDIYDMLNESWDLIIAHPECTCLCVSGNRTYAKGKPKHHMRLESAKWTEKFWFDCCEVAERVCFENPKGVLPTLTDMPKPQYIHPWQHGHMEQKETGLYLHNLDPLEPTNDVFDEMMMLPKEERERVFRMAPGPNRWKERSKTFTGIADAFAEQFGG